MVPRVAGTGKSFKGAMLYYMHDKREEGEDIRLTSERVEWAETRGMFTNDADLGWRTMAATAMDQDRIKRGAGIKATGRKTDQTVYAYSIGWRPDERHGLTKAEMIRAADESLRALGAEDCQAIFVAHNDTPHPHVHVIVNRVSPEDGRMLNIKRDHLTLSRWAEAYEKERGQILCEQRPENNKRRDQGEFVRYDENQSRPQHELNKAAQQAGANDNAIQTEKEKQRQHDAALALHGKSQAHRHKREWVDLNDRYRIKKAQINDHAKTAIDEAKAQIKEQYRPLFRELHRNQYKETQFFSKREASTFGKIENALYVVANRRHIDPDDSKGLMGHAFNFLTSKKARADALDKLHRVELKNLGFHQRQEVLSAVRAIDDDKTGQLTRAGKTYNADRVAIIQRQAEEKKELQAKWKQRHAERRRAFDTIVKKAEVKKRAPENQVKPEFKRAAEGRKPRRSRGRSRRRKRDR